jgi:hypothetical protein
MRHGLQFPGIWELGDGNHRRLRRRTALHSDKCVPRSRSSER